MRKRASVMEKIGWEQRWARIGVKAVMDPQAAAESRRTFSPPTLGRDRDKDENIETDVHLLLQTLVTRITCNTTFVVTE